MLSKCVYVFLLISSEATSQTWLQLMCLGDLEWEDAQLLVGV